MEPTPNFTAACAHCKCHVYQQAHWRTTQCERCLPPGIKLSICTSCKNAQYCNSRCQREDWPQHKAYCEEMKAYSNIIDDSKAYSLGKWVNCHRYELQLAAASAMELMRNASNMANQILFVDIQSTAVPSATRLKYVHKVIDASCIPMQGLQNVAPPALRRFQQPNTLHVMVSSTNMQDGREMANPAHPEPSSYYGLLSEPGTPPLNTSTYNHNWLGRLKQQVNDGSAC